MKMVRRLAALLLALTLLACLCACSLSGEDAAALAQLLQEAAEDLATPAPDKAPAEELILIEPEDGAAPDPEEGRTLDPDGSYTTREDVALYLHEYDCLPPNFITKREARDLGWSGGGLDDYAYGMCIGGDYFGNYEGLLPPGTYHECDIDTLHAKSRGAQRLIYSDDGRIYYTGDHYESFTLLYGEE